MTQALDFLDENLMAFLDVPTREQALSALVELLHAQGKLQDKADFHKAILERERLVSTAIGMGVALPHAKLPDYDDFFVALGIAKKGVDWHAMDEVPVRIIFMIGGPDDRSARYLQVLSKLTMAVKDEDLRKELLLQTSPEGICQVFRSYEVDEDSL